MVTDARSDFSTFSRAFYATKQLPVAWRYARWAKQIVNGTVVPIGVLAIAIPDNLLVSITQASCR
jgi:hypothetical protein